MRNDVWNRKTTEASVRKSLEPLRTSSSGTGVRATAHSSACPAPAELLKPGSAFGIPLSWARRQLLGRGRLASVRQTNNNHKPHGAQPRTLGRIARGCSDLPSLRAPEFMDNNTAALPTALFSCFLSRCRRQGRAAEAGCAVRRRGAGGGTGAAPAAPGHVRAGMGPGSAGGAGKGQPGGDPVALPAGFPGGASGGGGGGGAGVAMQVYYPGGWISRGEAAGSAPWGSTLARSTHW